MCGVEFCSMRIDQDARDAGEMDDIADETNLAASAAAEMNQPPTGTHDGGRVIREDIDSEWEPAEQLADD